MPHRLLEFWIKVEIRHEIAVLEQQNLDLMLVYPALEAMALTVLERILVDVAGRANDSAYPVLIPRVNMPHALALSVKFVFPRLERGNLTVSHFLYGFDNVPILLENRHCERLETFP